MDTNAAEQRVAYYEVRAPDGPRGLEIQTLSGQSRLLLGVIVERDTPGVVLDALGVQGASIRFLDQEDDALGGAAQGAQAEPFDLRIRRERERRRAVHPDGRVSPRDEGGGRAGPASTAGIELPDRRHHTDRAHKTGDIMTSMGIIPLLVAEQKKVSEELGCAFFDTFKAMGGSGSMPTWVRRGLGNANMTHPTGAGSETLGTWIYRALIKRYTEYQSRK